MTERPQLQPANSIRQVRDRASSQAVGNIHHHQRQLYKLTASLLSVRNNQKASQKRAREKWLRAARLANNVVPSGPGFGI